MNASSSSFLIFHPDGQRSSFCGVPQIHPTVISFRAAPGDSTRQAQELSEAVCDFLRALGSHVKPCEPECEHDAQSILSCPRCSQPDIEQLLVVVGISGSPAPSIPDVSWWAESKTNRHVLPVFPENSHPEQILPTPLQVFNAAFWKTSASELATTVLGAAGLTPESHRIFISYRRLETQPLADDLFEGLNELGFDVFLDRFAVPPAVNFQRRLHDDLGRKSMVLLLESDRFGESKWTTEEITYCKRNDLGLFSLRLPHGLDPHQATQLPDVPDEWRRTLNTDDFYAEPQKVDDGRGDSFLQWGRLKGSARTTILAEVRRRHDIALLNRRQNLRQQMLDELGRRGAVKYGTRADGLLAATGKGNKPYVVWITPRPPELPDFQAAHAGCQFPPNTVGVIVGLRNLLEPENRHRLTWLSGVCKLVLVDPGHIVSASRKIAEGVL